MPTEMPKRQLARKGEGRASLFVYHLGAIVLAIVIALILVKAGAR